MPYNKKGIPRDIRRLRERLERFEYILENYELEDPDGLLDEGRAHLQNVRATVNQYNQVLSQADELRDELDQQVRTGRDIHERLRMRVIGAFGRDSIEYEQIGGTRPSDIDYSRKSKPDDEQE